jgi:hypothetical protein
MKLYLRFLSILYLIGAILHGLDLLDLRLQFSGMSPAWKGWIVFLLVFDLIAAVGLSKRARWGIGTFLLVASAQLIAYLGFRSFFGDQWFLVVFHAVTVGVYATLLFRQKNYKLSFTDRR